jgi:hypothetical protein
LNSIFSGTDDDNKPGYGLGDEHSDCEYNHYFAQTNFFYNYSLKSNNSGWGGGLWNVYDFIPDYMIAKICSNNAELITPYSISQTECTVFMKNNYCINGPTLKSPECISFFTNRNNNENYDTIYTTFCKDISESNTEYANICACFYDQPVYEQYKDNVSRGLPDSVKQQVRNTMTKISCFYPKCSINNSALKPFDYAVNTCPSNTIQNCINEYKVNTGGNILGSTAEQNAINNCVINTTSGGGGGGGSGSVNCAVSDWSNYGNCSKTCGGGTQSRTRTITTQPSNGGQACPTLIETKSCNTQSCSTSSKTLYYLQA